MKLVSIKGPTGNLYPFVFFATIPSQYREGVEVVHREVVYATTLEEAEIRLRSRRYFVLEWAHRFAVFVHVFHDGAAYQAMMAELENYKWWRKAGRGRASKRRPRFPQNLPAALPDKIVISEPGVKWHKSPRVIDLFPERKLIGEDIPTKFAVFQRTMIGRGKNQHIREPQRVVVEGMYQVEAVSPEEALSQALAHLGIRDYCEYIVTLECKSDQRYLQLTRSHKKLRSKKGQTDHAVTEPTFFS